MAKKNKDARVQVILECTEQKNSGVAGMSRYITTKNKKNTPERLELKKYNPFLKKVTVHKEIKTSTGKSFAKVIRMVRSEKTGAYMFKEEIVASDNVKEYLSKK